MKSTNHSMLGISGKVVDETKNLLCIQTKKDIKKVPKEKNIFEIGVNGTSIIVDGTLLVGRPEVRVKSKNPKKRV